MEVNSNTESQTTVLDVNEETTATVTNESESTTTGATETVQTNSTEESSIATQETVDKAMNADNALETDLKARGIDFNAVADEYMNNGKLSDATQEALTNAGYPKEVIDTYIRSVQREADTFVSTVQGYVGNESEWNAFVGYVQSQGDATINLFNDAINTGNLGIIQATVNHIKTNMTAQYGTANPTVMGGQDTSSPDTGGYASTYEMTQAMSDKRYGRDKAYTRIVEQKVINSNFD